MKRSHHPLKVKSVKRLASVCSRLLPDMCVLSAYRGAAGQTEALEKRLKAQLGNLSVVARAMVSARWVWWI
jgi:hypothetical protein